VSRAARFAWVGAGGFVVQALTLHGLAAAGLPYPVATAVAVEAAILHNFAWHEGWTWNDRAAAGRRLDRLVRFNGATALISIGGNVALMGLLAGYFGLPLLPANLLAVLALSVVNFLSADRLVFTGGSEDPQRRTSQSPSLSAPAASACATHLAHRLNVPTPM
jgi:putative flippase GtrA